MSWTTGMHFARLSLHATVTAYGSNGGLVTTRTTSPRRNLAQAATKVATVIVTKLMARNAIRCVSNTVDRTRWIATPLWTSCRGALTPRLE